VGTGGLGTICGSVRERWQERGRRAGPGIPGYRRAEPDLHCCEPEPTRRHNTKRPKPSVGLSPTYIAGARPTFLSRTYVVGPDLRGSYLHVIDYAGDVLRDGGCHNTMLDVDGCWGGGRALLDWGSGTVFAMILIEC